MTERPTGTECIRATRKKARTIRVYHRPVIRSARNRLGRFYAAVIGLSESKSDNHPLIIQVAAKMFLVLPFEYS